MSTNYPTNLDSLPSPVATNPLDNPPHATLHIDSNDAIKALQTKVGIDNSGDTGSIDYIVRQMGFLVQENLAGANGIIQDFTLSFAPLSGTVSIYLNGVLLDEGDDYTISGLTIHFTIAPDTGAKIKAHYHKQI